MHLLGLDLRLAGLNVICIELLLLNLEVPIIFSCFSMDDLRSLCDHRGFNPCGVLINLGYVSHLLVSRAGLEVFNQVVFFNDLVNGDLERYH